MPKKLTNKLCSRSYTVGPRLHRQQTPHDCFFVFCFATQVVLLIVAYVCEQSVKERWNKATFGHRINSDYGLAFETASKVPLIKE